MAFSLKGFASGLADAGTNYIEDKQDRRKDATTAKRSLMFNATEKIYNDALAIKNSNDVIKNKDKKYISKIKSIDPTISTDNMNKLLSLSADDRKKAEGEYNYRAAQTPDEITFGDFMSAVEESTDLDDPTKIDANIETSMMAVPKNSSAYYDKTGLISDESVNDLYTEITGVLQEVHGFSVDKAKAITEQGIYSVQHPPIKINWSKDIAIQKEAIETLATAKILDQAKIKGASLNVINLQVDLTNDALLKMREAFAVGYESEQFDDDGNSLGLKVIPAALAPTMPNFESEFRNSKAYKEYAMTTISTYIMGMETDPEFNTQSAMTFMNGTFPGMYGGKIETRKLTEAAFNKINPNKIYYVDAPSPAGTDEDGFIMTGAQLKATRVDTKTKNDPKDVPATGVEVSATVKTLQEQLAFAIEMNAPEETITRIEGEIAEAMTTSQSDVTDVKFDTKQKKDAATSAKTFEPNAVTVDDWDKNLDLAIQMGDIEKVQLVVDFVEANPNTSYKSNMSPRNRLSRRSKVALADMMRKQNPTLQDTLDEISSVLPGSLLTKANRIDKDVARDFLKRLDSYPLPENTDELDEFNKVKKELYRNI
jgi:hypothetical protein